MLLTEIAFHTFTGSSIRPYLPSIARLSVEVYKEYPYLCDTSLEKEIEFLHKYVECEESIVVLIFEGSMIVGASTGIPLDQEPEFVKRPFEQKKLDVSKFYYFGESLLLKHYRGRGIGHHFFDLRESFVRKHSRYDHLCFAHIDRPEDDPLKPDDYRPLDDFWRKRGFVHHKDMKAYFMWKELDEDVESPKELSFWIKDLHHTAH